MAENPGKKIQGRARDSVEITEHSRESIFRSDVIAFAIESKNQWKEIVGGSFVFMLMGVAASAGLDVPKTISGIAAFCLAFSLACFLAFRSERRTKEIFKEALDAKSTNKGLMKKHVLSLLCAHLEAGYKLKERCGYPIPKGDHDVSMADVRNWMDGVTGTLSEQLGAHAALKFTRPVGHDAVSTDPVWAWLASRVPALREIVDNIDTFIMPFSPTPDKEAPAPSPAS